MSGEYRIVVDGSSPYAVLPVEAELAAGTASEEGLAGAVAQRIKQEIGASARVTLMPFGSLPRSEGKTRRVIRRDRP